jgi:hypothetical protein
MKYNIFHSTTVGLTPCHKWACFVFNEVRSAVPFAVDAVSLWYGLLQLNCTISFNVRYNGFLSFLVEALRLRHTKVKSNLMWEIDHEIHPCPTSQSCKRTIIYMRMAEKTWASNTERILNTECNYSQLKSVSSTSTFRQTLSFVCTAGQLLIQITQSANQHMHTYMCWFADWVTLLSARCKYKMISAQQTKLNNYKNTKLKLLKQMKCACVGLPIEWPC